jgi:hypothetical protein
MKKQTSIPTGIGFILSLCMAAAPAFAQEAATSESPPKGGFIVDFVRGDLGTVIPESPAKGLYGGIGFGAGYNTDLKDSWDDGSLSNRDMDSDEPAYKLFAGYQINPYVAVQGAYHDLGEYSMSATSDGTGNSWAAGSVSGEQEADGWSLSVVGRWPISERWTLFGTLGWFWWESTERYNENGFKSEDKESGSDVTFSGGLEFDHGHKDRIVYTFELGDQRVGDDNLDIITGFAGVLYRFP